MSASPARDTSAIAAAAVASRPSSGRFPVGSLLRCTDQNGAVTFTASSDGYENCKLIGQKASNTFAYPSPAEFISRWNVAPRFFQQGGREVRGLSDLATMHIPSWSLCKGDGTGDCLVASFCDGRASVTALRSGADFTYTVSARYRLRDTLDDSNQGCGSTAARIFGTLFSAPADRSLRLQRFLGLGERSSRESVTVLQGVRYDVLSEYFGGANVEFASHNPEFIDAPRSEIWVINSRPKDYFKPMNDLPVSSGDTSKALSLPSDCERMLATVKSYARTLPPPASDRLTVGTTRMAALQGCSWAKDALRMQ